MRNTHLINTFIAASLLSVGSMAMADDPAPSKAVTAPGGTVHFTGEIVNAACAVSADSDGQTVKLGQYRTAQFKNTVGEKTGLVPFTIKLQDCDTTVSTSAAVSFSGNADATDNTVLATSNIGGGASGAASGVGIEVADQQGKVLAPNSGTFSTAQTLNDGNNVLNFTARYKSTSAAVTPGKADADATFTMKYE
ncbi:type 1 fimbrial major subunit FimA [Serratia ficaria]|uniref:type 1 fimbrial major subunit FimA n=1 Tax=Serratia ficaria TaxID=61651 RepID=UPI00217C5271|nr:type 1 fimbrial major subunit FimA [Serratia ficaria]CAI1125862.1 Type-1A pilin [Serratia ficaria]CAI1539767.1 Type-1A pilin [Serratia ficaria]